MKNILTIKNSLIKVLELQKEPVIIRVNRFTEESAREFSERMDDAHAINQPIIPIVIDSYGGQVYSLLSMISDIKSSKIPVATIAVGKAMSCGASLLSYGTEGHRYISPTGTVMIHDVSSFNFGKVEEIKADAAETDRLNQLIFQEMAVNCGKDPKYFLNLIHEKGHADWYLDPTECKKHNLVNHIRVPKLQTEVDLKIKFE